VIPGLRPSPRTRLPRDENASPLAGTRRPYHGGTGSGETVGTGAGPDHAAAEDKTVDDGHTQPAAVNASAQPTTSPGGGKSEPATHGRSRTASHIRSKSDIRTESDVRTA
jgi:hypothetical protein